MKKDFFFFKLSDFKKAKRNNKKISSLTAYDISVANIAEKSKVDFILVGDSLGMVVYGENNTLKVTVEDIIKHSKAVRKGAQNSFIVADMPFLSYQLDIATAIKNAGKIISESEVDAVKLEGSFNIGKQIKAIIETGIAVMGHIGLTPQSVSGLGGYRLQGKTFESAKRLIEEAQYLEDIGVFAIIAEFIPQEVAEIISKKLSIPVIGIGSGNNCDGQILVSYDLLGLTTGYIPKFVRKYADLNSVILNAFNNYIKDINEHSFPSFEESTSINSDELKKLLEIYKQ